MQTKNKQLSPTLLKFTTVYGYSLFAALILTEVISVIIPFSQREDWLGNGRIIAVYVGIVGSLLLPPLISFLVGYYITMKSKTPYLRQFTGVVLALAGLYLTDALRFIPFRMYIPRPDFIPQQVHTFSYAILAVLIILLIAVIYKGTQNKQPLYRYTPIVFVLIGSLIASFFFYLSGGLAGNWTSVYMAHNVPEMITATISIPLFYFLSYRYSPTKTKNVFDRIIFAAVFTALYLSSVQMVAALLYAVRALVGNYENDTLFTLLAYPVALLIWGAYMYAMKRHAK